MKKTRIRSCEKHGFDDSSVNWGWSIEVGICYPPMYEDLEWQVVGWAPNKKLAGLYQKAYLADKAD
jgi:hypothetical protein